MRPFLFEIGDYAVPSYPLFYGLAIVVAALVIERLVQKRGADPKFVPHVVVLATLAIIGGGRAFYVSQHLNEFRSDWGRVLDISGGGQVFYGGMILAIVVAWLYWRIVKFPGRVLADAVAVAAPLGLAIGRVGCFLKGCCYGKVCAESWHSVQFDRQFAATGEIVGSPAFLHQLRHGSVSEMAGETLPVHATQLYSVAACLGIFVVMLAVWKARWLEGSLVPLVLALYAVVRFLVEFLRANETYWGGLTAAQLTGIPLFVIAVTWLLYRVGGGVGTVGRPSRGAVGATGEGR